MMSEDTPTTASREQANSGKRRSSPSRGQRGGRSRSPVDATGRPRRRSRSPHRRHDEDGPSKSRRRHYREREEHGAGNRENDDRPESSSRKDRRREKTHGSRRDVSPRTGSLSANPAAVPATLPKKRQSERREASPEEAAGAVVELPYGARALSRWDFAAFEPLFAHYLDLHKQVRLSDLDEADLRRRWRSFVSRWNAGELSEGWYEPEMFLRVVQMRVMDEEEDREEGRAMQAAMESEKDAEARNSRSNHRALTPPLSSKAVPETVAAAAARDSRTRRDDEDGGNGASDSDSDDSDDFGPAPPPPESSSTATRNGGGRGANGRHGPGIPSLQDLEERRADEADAWRAGVEALRVSRKVDRAEQRERLEELLPPRADAGTRERRIEKRRALNEKLRGFREGSAGATEEAGDDELMGSGGGGSGGGGADDYRAALASLQRKKTEREVRREEERRARAEELKQRLRVYHEREEATVGALRELAKQRFG